MISHDDVTHIAKLAKLKLSEDEIQKFTKELGSVLAFAKKLEEVDTDGVEETSQVTGLTNVTQKDEIEVFGKEDELLACSTFEKEGHCIRIPKIM